MDFNKRLKELEEEIQLIKDYQHNMGMHSAANSIENKLINQVTLAEQKFMQIAELKHLNLRYQHRIDIYKKRRITKFYFADFCDIYHKIVFEIDGDYHKDPEQQKKDLLRTKDLNKCGYKVFRITNEDVYAGKTTQFLINVYNSLGINI